MFDIARKPSLLKFAIVFYCVIVHGQGQEKNRQKLNVRRVKKSISPFEASIAKLRKCDQTGIPALDAFDVEKFSGSWYELGKTVSGYLDPDDGMWKLTRNLVIDGYNFVYSGRSRKSHCIRPISGTMIPSMDNPGELIIKYQTYTAKVSEKIRVLDTDYKTLAIVYTCMHIMSNGKCHPAGVTGSIWTRLPHVDIQVFDKAIAVLDKACIDSNSVMIRTKFGQGYCPVEELVTPEDHAVAPDFCYQQLNSGSCSGNLLRYYYDVREKQCKEFSFGGCGGNDNNFMSLQECEDKCVNFERPWCDELAKCALHCPPCCKEHDDGCVKCNCEDIEVDEFVKCVLPMQCPIRCAAKEMYPGCFVCHCEDDFIESEKSSICLEVKEPGTCGSKVVRYYYNANSERCEKFVYTGCGGNKNNFETLPSCMQTCQGTAEKTKVMKANIVPRRQPDTGHSTIKVSTIMTILPITVIFSFHHWISPL